MATVPRDVLSHFRDYRDEAERYRQLDDGRILVLDHLRGRGKAIGLDIGQTKDGGARLFDFGNGKVIRLVVYNDRDRAFADLGLTQEDDVR